MVSVFHASSIRLYARRAGGALTLGGESGDLEAELRVRSERLPRQRPLIP